MMALLCFCSLYILLFYLIRSLSLLILKKEKEKRNALLCPLWYRYWQTRFFVFLKVEMHVGVIGSCIGIKREEREKTQFFRERCGMFVSPCDWHNLLINVTITIVAVRDMGDWVKSACIRVPNVAKKKKVNVKFPHDYRKKKTWIKSKCLLHLYNRYVFLTFCLISTLT